MSAPRKLMHQMSLRAMLSPSPSPSPSPSHRRQSSMGTLFSDAWIARPTKTRRKSSLHSTGQPLPLGAHAGLRDIPLDGARTKTSHSGDSSETVAEKPVPQPPPEAGAMAADWEFHRVDSPHGWWTVAWAFLLCFVSLSTLANYPIYEAYYAQSARPGDSGTLTDRNRGEDDLAQGQQGQQGQQQQPLKEASPYVVLIGTLMSGFAALASLGAGIATDVVGLRICAMAGTVVLSAGLLASSFIDRLWALCLTQGVVAGVGVALMALPAYTAPAQWFERRRALATGIAVAGTAAGVVAMTPAYEALLRRRGMAVCLYVQALVTLLLGALSALGLRPRIASRSAASMHWRKKMCDLRVLALMAMALLAAAARFAQIACLPAVARAAGARDDATGVMYAMGVAAILGMAGGGWVADRTGYVAGIGLSELVLAVFTLALYAPAKSLAPMYAFSVVFGLTTGALAAVLPAAIAQMFGTRRLASTTGLVLTAAAPALLITTPAAVRLVRLLAEGGSIAWLAAISGGLSLAAGLLGLALPLLQRRHLKALVHRAAATTASWEAAL
ncbi:hypothetical protein H4R18_004746 [Coemansia javaensis]|uniref:Major facilitator superfamily (MFS) profile domain-containing protein n=1 Tax=Coemansia javaensis TaxID=2761396 RepID=A0A9W8H860_9FUNG|nr:hypothetical protein H4R18_004746 [Coemansia javaensis]